MTGPADKEAERIRAALDARRTRYDQSDVIDSYYEYVSPEDAILRELRESDLLAVLDEREQLEQQLFEARVQLTGAQARIGCFEGRASGPTVAGLDEREQLAARVAELKAEREGRLAQAYTSGWYDAIEAYRTPGWTEREAGWRKYREAVKTETVTLGTEGTTCGCGCKSSQACWCRENRTCEDRCGTGNCPVCDAVEDVR